VVGAEELQGSLVPPGSGGGIGALREAGAVGKFGMAGGVVGIESAGAEGAIRRLSAVDWFTVDWLMGSSSMASAGSGLFSSSSDFAYGSGGNACLARERNRARRDERDESCFPDLPFPPLAEFPFP
jgi:hypothetical protein